MTIGTTTALNIIQTALRRINSYQSGETLATPDENDALDVLNDLLDSLSLSQQFVFGANENVFTWIAGQRQYRVGNPLMTLLGSSPFTGTIGAAFNGQTATNVLTVNSVTSGALNVGDIITGAGLPANTKIATFGSGTGGTGTYNLSTTPGTIAAEGMTTQSQVITGITNLPTNLVTGAGAAYAMASGSILTDVQGLIPTNTTAVSSTATTITMSAYATANSSSADSISYTVPGDFPMNRPLRITSAFTRFNNLDFTLDILETQQQYNEILYKAQPGPWPTVAWYDYTFPYALLNVYQTPGNSAEAHIFSQTLLTNMTLNQVLVMPQGYARALKWLLSRELWTEFMGGAPLPPTIEKLAYEASMFIRSLNARPQPVARYDRELTRGNRPDGGWITHGGYR